MACLFLALIILFLSTIHSLPSNLLVLLCPSPPPPPPPPSFSHILSLCFLCSLYQVNPSSDVAGENGPEEDYVDLQPSEREIIEEEKEEDSKPQLPPSITARQPQLPPPPVLPKAPQQPLPPVLPKAPQQPLPPIPPPSSSSTPSTTANLRGYPPRPDPPVDTTKDYIQQPNGIQYNKVYVILWDFTASEKDELDLRRGDLVFVSDNKERQEWWYGELVNPDVTKKLGPKGLFPANYSSVAFQLVQ